MNRNWSVAEQKASNAIVEAISFDVIRDFYARQDPPIRMDNIRYNAALDLTGKQAFDLIDGYGKTWEVKHDKLSVQTGNVYIELQALEHSKADYYIILTFKSFVVPRILLQEAVQNMPVMAGGDNMVSRGVLLAVTVLEQLAI